MTIEVTQADREAAADWGGEAAVLTESQISNIRIGLSDENTLVQAFARHRIAARIEGARMVAAWLREKVEPCRQTASEIGESDDEALVAWVTRADTYEFAADAIESDPRAIVEHR